MSAPIEANVKNLRIRFLRCRSSFGAFHPPERFRTSESFDDIVDPATSGLVDAMTAGDCQACHTYTGGHIDHAASGRVTLPVSGNCDTCHDATVASGTFVNVSDNTVHDSCDTCHVDSGNNDYSLVALASGGVGGGDCTACHSTIDNGTTLDLFAHDVDHNSTSRVTMAANCTDCHADTVAYPAFTDNANNKKHDSCATCHTSATDLTLVALASGGVGGGDCSACHFSDFTEPHAVVAHDTRVADDPTCTGCHDATAGTGTGVPVDPADNKVHDSCGTCHTADGSLIDPATSGLVDAMTAGDCQACHTYTGGHIDHAASGRVTLPVSGNCDTCHDATVASGTFVNVSDNTVHDSCDTCHVDSGNNDYSLVALASGGVGGGDCTACHSTIDNGTTLDLFAHDVDHNSTSRVTMAANCTDCHADTVAYPAFTDNANNKKHDSCATCHTSATDLTLVALASGGVGGGDCSACHFSDFTEPHAVVAHDTRVADDPTCTGCHDATAGTGTGVPVDPADNKVHDSCGTCHTADGSLIDPATSGLVDAMTAGDCQACHTYTGGHIDHAASGRVTLPVSGNCDTCHDATVASGTFVNVSDNTVHDSCDTCHVDSGNNDYSLVALASGGVGGGDCTACHSTIDNGTTLDLFAHDVDHNSTSRVTMAANCTDCHADTVAYPVFTDDAEQQEA